MKFSLALPLLAVGAMASAGLQRKDLTDAELATVRQALINAADATTALDAQVNAFNGPEQTEALQAASDNVIAVLQAGKASVDQITNMITIDQGFTLLDQVNALNDAADKAVNDATNKKPVLVSACVGPTVLAALQDQLAAAKAFQTSVANRFNEGDERDLALQLSQPAIDSLQRGVDNFSDQTSLPSGCGTVSTPPTTPTPIPPETPSGTSTPEPTPSGSPSGSPIPEPTPSGSPTPPSGSISETPVPSGSSSPPGGSPPSSATPGTSGGNPPPTGGNPPPTGGAPGTSGGSVPSQTGGNGTPTPTKPSGPGFTGPVFTGAAAPMGVANVGAFAVAAFAAVAAF